ncbi:MAG: hypothetical protein ACKVT0_18755, partial [Planctomycetaceae bacterium]
ERCRRILPIAGEVLVQVGQKVTAREIVARSLMPGEVTPVNLANLLSVSPSDVAECVFKKAGDRIEKDEVIGRSKGLFGLFKTECRSPVSGMIETLSSVTGQMMVRGEPLAIEVSAFLTGTVAEVMATEGVVVESIVSLVQGIFGIGGEAYGPIRMVCQSPQQELTDAMIAPEHRGCIVVGGSRMTGKAIKQAIAVGAAGIISGGMDDQDLKEILGYDLGVAVTSSEKIGLTLILTEGFGTIGMAERTFRLLTSREGAEASINGTTQIRAGVVRPIIAVPWTDASEKSSEDFPSTASSALDLGVHVRIIRDPYFGEIGTVSQLPSELHTLDSGSQARVLFVKTADGTEVVVPRANVELIEG